MMELLSPVGRPESLTAAVLYGADAVYLAGEAYGLRAKAQNFDAEGLKEAVSYAHRHQVKVYVTTNIIAHNQHLEGFPEYIKRLEAIGVDAVIAADAGIISIIQAVAPSLEIHLSTQASSTNYATFNFWHRQGIARIVAARECSLREIAEIRANTDPSLEIEAFGHGAMCISISGRCLLSNYLSGRDSNLGACTHPCRWTYRVVEESRPGEYFPVTEEEGYTYLFNSKDLCMIDYLEEMERAGITSLKIEGRMKSPLYVALVTKAYREALDDLNQDPALYRQRLPYYHHLLEMSDQRGFTTGFYLDKPTGDDQLYHNPIQDRIASFAGLVIDIREGSEKKLMVEQRGKFSVGDTLLLLLPGVEPVAVPITEIINEDGEAVESAPHAKQKIQIPCPAIDITTVPLGAVLLRRENEG